MYLNSKIIAIYSGNLWEKIVSWYQNSVIRELLDYLEANVFHMEFGTYENFVVQSGTGESLRNIIVGLVIGMVIAAGLISYTRVVHGRFVRVLLKKECLSPERAITLREAGLFRDPSIRRELAKGGALAKVTRCVRAEEEYAAYVAKSTEAVDEKHADGEGNPSVDCVTEACDAGVETAKELTEQEIAPPSMVVAPPDFKPDFLTDRFYIPEELKYRADFRYERHGSDVLQLVLTVLLGIAATFLLCRYLPTLLGAADWLISALAPA